MNGDGHQPHILVVDDSPDILDLKDDILEAEGYRVSTRLRKGTQVSDIATIRPDLLVMDYDESSLMEEVATDPRTRQIPILLCTGAIREVQAIMSQLSEIGVRVIFKPFDIDDLIAVVRDLLGQSRASDGSSPSPAT